MTKEDHDLLIRLDGKVDLLMGQQQNFLDGCVTLGIVRDNVKQLCKDIDRLNAKDTVWAGINSLAVAVVAFIAYRTGR